jgi:predicted  nucleic acid-binding Zn-ribbon protein
MSAANPESVAAGSKDALRASASASVAADAASPASAASSSSPPLRSLEHELATVKQQLAALQPKIDAVEKRRDARSEDDPLWIRADDELKQLRTKEALLLKKEEQVRDELKRKEMACVQQPSTTGQCR